MTMQAKLVGQPIERIEDLRLLRGRGQFVDDLVRPGMLHAVVLRSPMAHGLIRVLDVSAARAMPGVVAVITAGEIGLPLPVIPLRLAPWPALEPYAQPVIAAERVRYVGEPIAVVVADSADIGEDALDAILLEIESLPPVVTTAASRADESCLFEDGETGVAHSNCALVYDSRIGDARQEFADSVVISGRFDTQRHTAATMEMRGVLAEWDESAGHLTVWGAAKVPFTTRAMLAKQIGLPIDAIDMIECDVGGGFGMRGEFYPEDFLIPFAARHVGRPVKWAEDRREHLLTCNHAREYDGEVELVCRPDGTILALRGVVNADVGAYIRANATIPARNIGQFMSGPYRIPNIDIQVLMLVTNKTPTGTYRGPGRFETDFFRERLFDLAARQLGIDPVEFRRRNLVTSSELPWSLATVSSPEKAEELDCGDYHGALDQCLEAIGWAEKQPLQGKLIDGRWHGLGVACFIEGGAAGPRENARMVLERDGSVSVYVGSAIVGQGLETVCLQIAGDALALPMEKLRIFHGSTTYLKEGWGSYHSRSTVMGGSAIIDAAGNLKRGLAQSAGLRLNCAPEDVVLQDGMASAPSGASISWQELAAEKDHASDGTFANHHHTYAYGAHAAHVAVDPGTGHVALLDYVAVEDVGRIVNPLTMQGQVIGALVQGLGGVFLEHLPYDAEGQMLAGSFADYLLPTASDFPNLRSIVTENYPTSVGPLGAKGAGEGGVIPVGGVIANAVAAALVSFGVEPNSLPLSPSRVWALIDEAQAA